MNGITQCLRTKVSRGIALFIMLLLFAGTAGTFASSRLMSWICPASTAAVQRLPADSGHCLTGQGPEYSEARKLALAYYAQKYKDSDVEVEVIPHWDYLEADVRKNGELVKDLSIKGDTVTEQRTGMSDWAINLLTNVN